MDTLLRHWHMLKHIPRYPQKVSTADLEKWLKNDGFETSRRTIQRDLDKLSLEFPLCTDNNKPAGWSWEKNAKTFDLPGMDTATALTFNMVNTYLKMKLPHGCADSLKKHFDESSKILQKLENSDLSRWPDKIRIVPRYQQLQPPTIAEDVTNMVYEALFFDRQFTALYKSRGDGTEREVVVNPLGLVFSDPVVYLVANMWNYSDVRLLALHRFRDVRLLDEKICRPDGFCLDHYLENGMVGYPVTSQEEQIKLHLRMAKDVAYHLTESPLSDDQAISIQDEGWSDITATVSNCQQLRWWLLGFGEKVEVLQPASLRQEMIDTVTAMTKRYQQ